MCRLIEPDGTPNIIVSWAYAVNYCRTHEGWTWEWYTEEEKTGYAPGELPPTRDPVDFE